jgi:hypothetical protein
MNHTTRPLARLVALATTALGLLLLTAGQALAQRPVPGPDGTGAAPAPAVQGPVQPTVDASISVLQWTLFAVAVLAALVVGAALMKLALRHRDALPVVGSHAAAGSSA